MNNGLRMIALNPAASLKSVKDVERIDGPVCGHPRHVHSWGGGGSKCFWGDDD